MCRLMFLQGNVKKFKDVVEALSWASITAGNDDGFGLANAKVYYRTLKKEKFFKKLKENLQSKTLLHFRMASAGSVKISNTHPFRYLGYYFAHNGTITSLASSSHPYGGGYTYTAGGSSYYDRYSWLEDRDIYPYSSKKKTAIKVQQEDKTDSEKFISKIQQIEKNHLKNLMDRYNFSGVIYGYNPAEDKLVVLSSREHYIAKFTRDNAVLWVLSSQEDILTEYEDVKYVIKKKKKVWLFTVEEKNYKPFIPAENLPSVEIISLPKGVYILDLKEVV